jgi:hypothetical protein
VIAARTRPTFARWTLVLPLVALTFWIVGFLSHRYGQRVERPIAVTPATQTQLAPIVLPLRTRVLAGTVVGPDDQPIDDALVSLVASGEPHWTFTDDKGRFRLEGLERGEWNVTVTATAHTPLLVTLPDDETEHVVRLPDAARAMPTFTPRVMAPLSGHVTAAIDGPLDGTEVVLTPVLPLEMLDAPLPRRTVCDREGKFSIDDLQVGDYVVSVLPAWARDGTWPDLARRANGSPVTWKHATGAGELAIALENGALHGVVADRQGRALEGALVLVSSSTAPERVWPPVAADAQGAFTVLDLPPGKYVVAVRAGPGSQQVTADVGARTIVELALPPLAVERPR